MGSLFVAFAGIFFFLKNWIILSIDLNYFQAEYAEGDALDALGLKRCDKFFTNNSS